MLPEAPGPAARQACHVYVPGSTSAMRKRPSASEVPNHGVSTTTTYPAMFGWMLQNRRLTPVFGEGHLPIVPTG